MDEKTYKILNYNKKRIEILRAIKKTTMILY